MKPHTEERGTLNKTVRVPSHKDRQYIPGEGARKSDCRDLGRPVCCIKELPKEKTLIRLEIRTSRQC